MNKKILVIVVVAIAILILIYYNIKIEITPKESFDNTSYVSQSFDGADMTENKTTSQYFQNIPSDNKKQVILVYANWCGHCQRFLPVWEELKSEEKSDIKFDKVESKEIDHSPILSQKDKNIDSFPTLIFKNNNKTVTLPGAMSKQKFTSIKEHFFAK